MTYDTRHILIGMKTGRLSPLLLALIVFPLCLFAQNSKIEWTSQEQPIVNQIRSLRSLPDDVRAKTTRQLALDIRALPASEHKVGLASGLASLSTEGDFGQDTLQEVTTTLAEALKETQAPPNKKGKPDYAYTSLAQLSRYEHMQVSLKDPQYAAALARLEAEDQKREQAEFTLKDLNGKSWDLRSLNGKVVLVNFWATWCPPCRKELPDLEALYEKFKDQGFLVLAISDEETAKVESFVAAQKLTYPVLIDSGRKVNEQMGIEGIPKTFLYNREGKLVAQAIDMRTRHQFEEMLAQAGLK